MSTSPDFSFLNLPKNQRGLGSAQHDVLFSVLQIIYRQAPPAPAGPPSEKVKRLSCCCRISELIPLVRQLHDEARAQHRPDEDDQQQAA